MDDLVKLGSDTAKGGFKNEDNVIERFNNWKSDELAQGWLIAMNYVIDKIEYVRAEKIRGNYKADVQVQVNIEIQLKKLTDTQNLQVKLVSNPQGFNQVGKNWVDKYVELWNIPQNITQLLKYFTGEIEPHIGSSRDSRRMFIDEFKREDQEKLVKFIQDNQTLIVSDILKGRGKFSAEWMLVILKIKDEKIKWALKPMNFVLNFYGNGDVEITKQGSIRIGKITIQRKGGDGGKDTAKMLQFKINPRLLIN